MKPALILQENRPVSAAAPSAFLAALWGQIDDSPAVPTQQRAPYAQPSARIRNHLRSQPGSLPDSPVRPLGANPPFLPPRFIPAHARSAPLDLSGSSTADPEDTAGDQAVGNPPAHAFAQELSLADVRLEAAERYHSHPALARSAGLQTEATSAPRSASTGGRRPVGPLTLPPRERAQRHAVHSAEQREANRRMARAPTERSLASRSVNWDLFITQGPTQKYASCVLRSMSAEGSVTSHGLCRMSSYQ